MTKYMFLLLLFGLQSLYVAAGSFRSLSVKEGLSSRQAFQINKDSAGFIWVYTHLGVDRYDGNEIRHYTVDNTVESGSHILSSTVLTCDKPGNSWIAMKNGKIYAYDRRINPESGLAVRLRFVLLPIPGNFFEVPGIRVQTAGLMSGRFGLYFPEISFF